MRVDFGKASLLVTGDLETPAIKDLIKRYEGTGLLDVDMYIVGHHGSSNGTTAELVSAMSPDLAVVNVGKPDHDAKFCAFAFGHPRNEIIEMLTAGVSETRDPFTAKVVSDAKKFEDRSITRAIYATGWDGDVVFDAGADGVFRVLREHAMAGR